MLELPCADGAFPSVGGGPSRRRSGSSARSRSLRLPRDRRAGRAALARSWPLAGARIRSGGRAPHDGAPDAYAFLAARGRRACTRFRSAPSMPGSSSPAISAFTPAARRRAAGGAARLCPQGRRWPDARRERSSARAQLAARVSGDSTVAYSFAFARAVEAALGVEAPPRAHWLRGLMAELERLANHFGDIGAICNDAAFSLMHAHCGILRERMLRARAAAFGHRLMMDAIVPGGVAVDLTPSGREAIRALFAKIREACRRLVALYDNTASLQDRTVGDRRAEAPISPRNSAPAAISAAHRGATSTRAAPSPIRPTTNSASRFRSGARATSTRGSGFASTRSSRASNSSTQILARLPGGPVRAALAAPAARRGPCRWSKGFRGDVFARVRLDDDGTVARCHLRDSVMVPMAAAGGGDRRQHRRRLPALQQVVQLLLLRARSLGRHAQDAAPRLCDRR